MPGVQDQFGLLSELQVRVSYIQLRMLIHKTSIDNNQPPKKTKQGKDNKYTYSRAVELTGML